MLARVIMILSRDCLAIEFLVYIGYRCHIFVRQIVHVCYSLSCGLVQQGDLCIRAGTVVATV